MALQPTAATTSAGRKNALTGRERLIQTQTRAAQEKFLPDLTESTGVFTSSLGEASVSGDLTGIAHIAA